jgi:hypothetical protein
MFNYRKTASGLKPAKNLPKSSPGSGWGRYMRRSEMDPGLINSDCYGQGWLYKIRPANTPDLGIFFHGPEAVEKWMLDEMKKYEEELKG